MVKRRMTKEAAELLAKVDEGGVPAFLTTNILMIARENGFGVVLGSTTPNEIVSWLRELRQPKRHWWNR